MIWASNAEGRTTYLSPEWSALTGQTVREAEGLGWLEVTHPEDRDTVRSVVAEANSAAADFTITFRLRQAGGTYVWVTAGAMPSFSPQDGRFLGFLGSVSEASARHRDRAFGRVGHYQPQPPTPLTQAHSALDLIADHLLMARALAVQAGEEMLRSIIDMSLLETGQRLAQCHIEGNGRAVN